MSAEDYRVSPAGVILAACGSETAAEEILALLGSHARIGVKPGEFGVIVFPADAAPFFEVATDERGERIEVR